MPGDLPHDEDALVREYEGLVVQLASDIAKRYRLLRALDDLKSFGREGLILAARSYDPARGTQFSTWAWYKVRSRILDGCREQGLVRRRSAKQVKMAQAFAEHQAEGLDAPTSGNDFASIVGDLDAMVQDAAAIALLCDPADVELESEPTSRTPRPDVELETKTVSSYVRETVETLGEPHRTFLKKSFFEDKSMSQIASEQKCSKSWVCRIRREAIQMLRRRLDAEAVRD